MRLIERQYEFTVEAPRAEVFALLSDVRNLNRVTPEWFEFEVLTESPGEMRQGALIDYWLRYRLMRVRWQSRVREWNPPRSFSYEQERGPFRYFRHEHLFFEESRGTRVSDRVCYMPPGGRVADRVIVRGDLDRIFSFRQEKVAALIGPRRCESVRQVAVAD